MERVRLFQIDAFAERLFEGNPAAVCLIPEKAPEAWMQALAGEMNLSETAFVRPTEDGFELRWFTPLCEVDLCGHATVAAAHALWLTRSVPASSEIVFHTASGPLRVEQRDGWIAMDFPAAPAREQKSPPDLEEALGVQARWSGWNGLDWCLQVESPACLRTLQPDFSRLARLLSRGVIVTSDSDESRYDFLSRFFAPAVGIEEDPVTGSAHCCLGPYWGQKLNKFEMVGYQASARGGTVGVTLAGDRVILRGKAVQVFETTVGGP